MTPRSQMCSPDRDRFQTCRAELAPATLRMGVPEFLLLMSPWTIAIPIQYAGVRPLHLVGLGLLAVSVYRRSISVLNAIAQALIACVAMSLLWGLILTIAAQDRPISGSQGVLAEIDNTLTPVLWISAAAYVGLLPVGQRAAQVGLLMRSMLAFAAFNLALQLAQLARVSWATGLVRFSERTEMIVVQHQRAAGFFDQTAELGYFLGIMTALVLTHRRVSTPLRSTALLLMLVSSIAAGDKAPLYALLGLILVSIRHITAAVLALVAAAIVILKFLPGPLERLLTQFTTNDAGLINSLSSRRFGSEGLVSNQLILLLAEQPTGLGYGSKMVGLVDVAYDSEVLMNVAILGFFGLVVLLALLLLMVLGAWLSDNRRQAFSLLLVFLISAQDLGATSASSSAAFFWLSFTMIALLRNHGVGQEDQVPGACTSLRTYKTGHIQIRPNELPKSWLDNCARPNGYAPTRQ